MPKGPTSHPDSPFVEDDAEIEKGVQNPEAFCYFENYGYEDGDIVCINQWKHKCKDGKWLNTRKAC
jgi:hypothetical protein